jgi:hypothetical protein
MITNFDKYYESKLLDILHRKKPVEPVEDESEFTPIPLIDLPAWNRELYGKDLLNFFQENIIGKKITVLATKLKEGSDEYDFYDEENYIGDDRHTFRLKKIRLNTKGVVSFTLLDDNKNFYHIYTPELKNCLVYAKNTRKYNTYDPFGEEIWDDVNKEILENNKIEEVPCSISYELDKYYVSTYGHLPVSEGILIRLFIKYFKEHFIGKKVKMGLDKSYIFILKDITTNSVDIRVTDYDDRVYIFDFNYIILVSTLVWKEKIFTKEDPFGEDDWEDEHIHENTNHLDIDPFDEEDDWEPLNPNLNPVPKNVRYIGDDINLFWRNDRFKVIELFGNPQRAVEEFGINDYLPIECVNKVVLCSIDTNMKFKIDINLFLKYFEAVD